MTAFAHDLSQPQASLQPGSTLLSPAGNWDCAKAAIENGADAIYFGLERFNARMRADNFTEADLSELMAFLHQRGVKGYVTLNTLIFQDELSEVMQYLQTIIAAGVDAAIVQDVGLCRLIRQISPDFPIHASTQMTVTSTAGVEFAKALGCQLVVLARECSLKEIRKIQTQLTEGGITFPLEVFVHGALCVAYSGQCLTSEALGGRSANRGECAQACRMPYELVVDGQVAALGDRKYLLSPQDLAGLEVLPELLAAGVSCLKIEGRLKTPEYVANVTRVYREAIDHALGKGSDNSKQDDRYNLEMAFSRGLYTGWFRGIDNQELVHARFGKKRGVYLGEVVQIQGDKVVIQVEAPLKAGDGVVFDNGHPERPEEGGRVYTVIQQGSTATLTFGKGSLDFKRIRVGDKLWKTNDPELDRRVRQSYAGDTPKFQRPIDFAVHGGINQVLTLMARDAEGHVVQVDSQIVLVAAEKQPLTSDRLQDQLGRLGNTPFCLGELQNFLEGDLILPVKELNRMRREVVDRLLELRSQPKRWQINPNTSWQELLPAGSAPVATAPELIVLVRSLAQLTTALECGISTLYCELEDPRVYDQAVKTVRASASQATIWVAPPRIAKPNERWILEQVRRSEANGYLIRNYDHLQFFQGDRCIGDFSLNIANAIAADVFKQFNLERLTASYDLNIQQLEALLRSCPPGWFEITLHQHMPMFHMEHCVFCAFLSEGKDFRDCGRPCETHAVKLRVPEFHAKGVQTGTEHVLQADAGCRNTVFNGTAQTGAEYLPRLVQAGCAHLRIEFLQESPQEVQAAIARYQQLLKGEITGTQLWKTLKLQHQLGVTRGTLTGSAKR
jgi:putative protease